MHVFLYPDLTDPNFPPSPFTDAYLLRSTNCGLGGLRGEGGGLLAELQCTDMKRTKTCSAGYKQFLEAAEIVCISASI